MTSKAWLQTEITRLETAIAGLKRQLALIPEISEGAWKVLSRSNGRPHFVVYSGGEWNCHCEGAINHGYCWAMNGVKAFMTEHPGTLGGFYFNDDKGYSRTARRLS